jgi:CRP-like cAMP-binding protein
VTSTSEELLGALPLFAGLDLSELAPALAATELASGEQLWRQGEDGDALYVVESGTLEVAGRLPGRREVTLATLGPGEVLGELALLDGGVRTASVRALEPARVLGLRRAQLRSLVVSGNESARPLRRRLLELACSRLCERHRALAARLSGEPVAAAARPGCNDRPPDASYVSRLPFFAGRSRADVDELLASASVERVERGVVLAAENEQPRGLFVTLNGAVEEVIRRDGGAIRVGLAGPGRAFAHAVLVEDDRATATAAARERSVVLVLEPRGLEPRFSNDAFATAVERDVVHALRQAERPQARLAAQVAP